MSKNPARLDDEHNCAIKPHGKGKVVTADDTVLFQGKPVAREGDTVKCHDGSETKIKEGQGCVVVNGKRVALVGDKTEHDGEITSGADGIHVDEGKPFVFIGPNVRIGGNVSFKVRKAPAPSPQPTTTGASQGANAAAAASSTVAEENSPNMWPSAEVKIAHTEFKLPPTYTQSYFYTIAASNAVEANLKVINKKSVNPITFDKEGFAVEAKNEAIKVLSDYKIKDPKSVLNMPPTITLYNDQDDYSFALTLKALSANAKVYEGSISKDIAFEDGEWIIKGEVNMNLTITLTKRPPESSWETTLTYDLQYALEEMQKYLTFEGELAFQLAKATVIALGAFYTFLNTLPEL